MELWETEESTADGENARGAPKSRLTHSRHRRVFGIGHLEYQLRQGSAWCRFLAQNAVSIQASVFRRYAALGSLLFAVTSSWLRRRAATSLRCVARGKGRGKDTVS